MKPWKTHQTEKSVPFTVSTVPFGAHIRTLDDLLARAETYAISSMREAGRLMPTLFILGIEGPQMLTSCPLNSETAKDDFAAAARLLCIARAATATVMALESWATFAKPGQPLFISKPPSESLDRQELVFLMGEEHGRQKQKILPIIRSETGGFVGFGESQLSKVDAVKGRFAELLASQTASAEQRNLAEALLRSKGILAAQPLLTTRPPRYRM